jgi:hypothetical protein
MENEKKGSDTKVEKVTKIDLQIQKSEPPTLVITATGQSKTGSSQEGVLVPFEYIRPPENGIFEFTFFEGSGGYETGTEAKTINEVKAEYRWESLPKIVKGVKIYAATNDLTKMLDEGNGGGGNGENEGKCTDWKAIHDFMPPKKGTLRVTGSCEFRTGGYTVELKPHAPQGFNPKIYLLDKVVTPPTGSATQQVTKVEVNYSEETEVHYTQVQILPDGDLIDVQEVS